MRNPNATTILEYLEAFGTLNGKEADNIMALRVQFGDSELELASVSSNSHTPLFHYLSLQQTLQEC